MDTSTWIALGAMVLSGLTVGLNIFKAWRERHKEAIEDSSEVLRAKSESKLNSVEAAERVIQLYSETLSELRQEVTRLKARVAQLEEANGELQQTNISLRAQLNGETNE